MGCCLRGVLFFPFLTARGPLAQGDFARRTLYRRYGQLAGRWRSNGRGQTPGRCSKLYGFVCVMFWHLQPRRASSG